MFSMVALGDLQRSNFNVPDQCTRAEFLASVYARQTEVFSLRIAHMAQYLQFSTKGIFSDGPKGLERSFDLCACS